MNVLHEEHILQNGKHTHRSRDNGRNLDPLPHLLDFLSLGFVSGVHDLFLATDAGAEVGNGLGFHFGGGAEFGDGLVRSALGDGGAGASGGESGPGEGAGGEHG